MAKLDAVMMERTMEYFLKVQCDKVGRVPLMQIQNIGEGTGLWRKGMSAVSDVRFLKFL